MSWAPRIAERVPFVVVALGLAAALSACGTSRSSNEPSSPSGQSSAQGTTSTADTQAESTPASLEDITSSAPGVVMIGVFEPDSRTVAAHGVDDDGRDVSPDQPFHAASVAKALTATTVLQLVDAGLVDLDAEAAEYLDFPIRDGVTVRHLLSHTSGTPDTSDHHGRCGDESVLTRAKELAATESGTEPGTASEYSSTNYLLLGMLIKAVTGNDPGAHMQANILTPLAMADTYWYESQSGPDPYWPPSATPGPAACSHEGPTIGTDGALVTTLADLHRFLRGLFASELVSETSLDSMLELNSQIFGSRYGLGLQEIVNEEETIVMYGAFGSFAYETNAFHDPEIDRSVIVVTTDVDGTDLLWQAVDWANTGEPHLHRS